VDAIEAQVDVSVAAGATVLTGGSCLDRAGAYFAPTVLADVRPDMPVWWEGTFGPVAAVVTVDGEDDARAAANDTAYGLGASVWTSDPERGATFGRRVRSGAFFVNAVVASKSAAPLRRHSAERLWA
jgi:succinate-semialdehyde dehydrogenase / glutarate-semialdehyde dehydrogenase